ncbi:MAG: acyl-CoA dehydrogenase family protein [Gammaproteobacteria bacterium]|nr:acyl-CoA dehydrogenase family protein [Gammaproteobacteria bacterium]
MDFSFSSDERAFRDRVRAFIEANPPAGFEHDGMDGGYGAGAHSRSFMRALGAAGFIGLTWPASIGGQEQPFSYKLILLEELALAGAPFGPLVGVDQAAEVVIRFGSERLRGELLPAIRRGEILFWQGFSEPEAGSDLLALRTRATRQGDRYRIDGHKIWSSHAGVSDIGLLLARTDPQARAHQGVTMFALPNGTPGLSIQPIRSMAGAVYHHEVFLDGVELHQDHRLGEENAGFAVLLKGLDSDRFWGRFYKGPALARILDRLERFAREQRAGGASLWSDSETRRRFARLRTEVEVVRTLFWHCGCLLRDGDDTPYQTALYKVQADELGQKIAAFGMQLLGPHGTLAEGAPHEQLDGEIRHLYLSSMGQTIAGGTSEVLRTTVATRGLGLPRARRA